MRLQPEASKKLLIKTVRELGSYTRMKDVYNKAGYSSVTPIQYHFGNFKKLLKSAGLEVDEEPTKLKLIRIAKELGPNTTGQEILRKAGFKSNDPILNNFGTIQNLLKSAGFNYVSGNEKLIIATKKLGRSATRKEIQKEAGFSGNGAVTHHFHNLENLFKAAGVEKSKSVFEEVEFSRGDERFKIRIPEEINEDVAEETGIHLGDGHCSSIKKKNGGHGYCIIICGSMRDEMPYYNQHIKQLYERLYNKEVKPKVLGPGTYGICVLSKAIFTFKTNVLKLPNGKKCSVCKIPDAIIQKEDNIIKSCIRGIVDTDFGLEFANKYRSPTLSGSFASKELVAQLKTFFSFFGYNPKTEFFIPRDGRVIHRIRIHGKKMLEKYVSDIGFNNPKHMTKYQIWREFGHCPPRTTLNDRILVLRGKKELSEFIA